MSVANKLYQLFTGSDLAHGTYEVYGSERGDGKRQGKASVVRTPATVEMWEEHLNGGKGLGIIPIRSDNTCQWGAIDIDDYGKDDPNKFSDLVKRFRKHGVPAVVGRSKSGGAHIWFFVSQPIDAADMQVKLRGLAAALGKADSEIFPKQAQILAERNDVGNFLNMPYHNGVKSMRFGFDDNGNGLTAEEFVEYAQRFVLTPDEFYSVGISLGVTVGDHLTEGPPCLQYLCSHGFVEGSRNNGLFNLGVYARLVEPDDWEGLVSKYNYDYFKPMLNQNEVKTVVQQLKKKDYFYKCNDQPIKPHCNKDLCRQRKYGIGGETAVNMSGIVKIDDPKDPLWIVNVDGLPVAVRTKELHSQQLFQERCMAQINKLPSTINARAWQTRLQQLMQNITVVPIKEESTDEGEFKDLLIEFGKETQSQDKLFLHRGFVYDSGEGMFFQLKSFKKFLEANNFKAMSKIEINVTLKKFGGTEDTLIIDGKVLDVWCFPQDFFGSPAVIEGSLITPKAEM